MLITSGKTNWLYVLIATIAAVYAGWGILFLQYKWSLEDSALLEPPVVQRPIILSTEIDQNFLTQVNQCFIPAAAVYGYTLRITSDFRTIEEQDQLFDQGRIEDGRIISWAPAGKSLHNYGLAVDVVDRWKGYNIDWKRLGRIAVFCGLEQVDDPHFENRGGLATAQFESGLRPASLSLPCAFFAERAEANQPLTLKDLKNCGAPNFWNNN